MLLQLEAERFRRAVLAKDDVPGAIAALHNDLRLFSKNEAANPSAMGAVPHNLFIVCAEMALEYGRPDISNDATELLFSLDPRAEHSAAAYFCRAKTLMLRGIKTPGVADAVVKDLLKTVEYATQSAVDQARLLYSVSVLYWRIRRSSMQDGKWHELLPSIQIIVDALATAEHGDDSGPSGDILWTVRLMFTLAKAKLDAGEDKEATKIVKGIYKLLEGKSESAREAAARIQLAMDVKTDLIAKLKLTNPVLDLNIKLRLSELSGDAKKHGKVLEDTFAKLMEIKGVKNEEEMKSSDWDGEVDGERRRSALAALVRTGRQMLQADDQADKAKAHLINSAVSLVKHATDAGDSAIDAELLAIEIAMHLQQSNGANEYSAGAVARCLDMITKALAVLQRTRNSGNGELIQRVCCIIWNMSRPLLQANLRHHLRRPLQKVVEALGSIQSVMLDLQCKIHIELAKIADDAGLITTVAGHVARATQLDESSHHAAALDALSKKLATLDAVEKLNRDDSEMSASQRISALIQQSVEGAAEGLRRLPLIQAGSHLELDLFHNEQFPEMVDTATSQIPRFQAIDSELAGVFARVEKQSPAQSAEGVAVWSRIAHVARGAKNWDIAYAACRLALWCISTMTDEALTTAQAREKAELSFILGEVCVQLLRSEGCQLADDCSGDADEQRKAWCDTTTAAAFGAFTAAAGVGAEVAEPWIMINAGVYLWNYSTKLIIARKYAPLVAPFTQYKAAIDKLAQTCPDPRLIVWSARYTNVIARAAWQQFCDEEAELLSNAGEGKKGQPATPSTESLQAALELCDNALASLGDYSFEDASELIASRVRILLALKKEVDVPKHASAIQKAFTLVAGCELDTHSEELDQAVEAALAVSSRMEESAGGSQGKPLGLALKMSLLTRSALLCTRSKHWTSAIKCASLAITLGDPRNQTRKQNKVVWPRTVQDRRALLFANECAMGLATAGMANGTTPGSRAKAKAHILSLEHFTKALYLAVSYNALDLVEAAARYIWNTALPVVTDAFAQGAVIAAVRAALWQLSRVEGKRTENKLMIPEKLSMYTLLFELHAAKKDWAAGLEVFEHALASIPRPSSKALWTYRLVFRSKMGESMNRDMARFEQEPPAVHAEAWKSIADVRSDPKDRLLALEKAAALLKGEAGYEIRYTDCLTEIASYYISIGEASSEQVIDTLETGIHAVSETAAEEVTPEAKVTTNEIQARLHCMIAQLECSFARRKMHSLLAYAKYVDLWSTSLQVATRVVRTRLADAAGPDDGKKKKTAKGGGSAEPVFALPMPATVEEWATFEIPADAIGHLKAEMEDSTCHTIFSLSRPELVAHHALALCDELQALGLDHLQFPALLLARSQFCEDGAGTNVHGLMGVTQRLADLCRQLGFAKRQAHYGALYDTYSDQVAAKDEPLQLPAGDFDVLKPVRVERALLDQAQVHINNQAFARAQVLLAKAKAAAIASRDTFSLSRIHVCHAALGVVRDQPGKAIANLKAALSAKDTGTPTFWAQIFVTACDTSAGILLDLIANDQADSGRQMNSLVGMLVNAAASFEALAQDRKHAGRKYKLAAAEVKLRTARFLSTFIPKVAASSGSADIVANELYVTAYTLYTSAATLALEVGAVVLHATALFHHATTLLGARVAGRIDADKNSVLEACKLLQSAEAVLMELEAHRDAILAAPTHMPKLLPSQSLCLRIQLSRCALDAELHQFSIENALEKMLEQHRVISMEEMIKRYVESEESDFVAAKREWENTADVSGERAMASLQAMLKDVRLNGQEKAQAFQLLGRILRFSAAHERNELSCGLSAGVWPETEAAAEPTVDVATSVTGLGAIPPVPEETGVAAAAEPETAADAPAAAEDGEAKAASLNPDLFERPVAGALGAAAAGETDGKAAEADADASTSEPKRIDGREAAVAISMHHQAVDALSTAVETGLENGLYRVVEDAAFDLVECVGLADAAAAVQYMALYQSCRARSYFHSLFMSATAPAFSSQEKLIHNCMELPGSEGNFGQQRDYQLRLETSTSTYQRLAIRPSFFEDAKEKIPGSVCCLVLQHGPGGKHLYAGVVSNGAVFSNPETETVPLLARKAVNSADLAAISEAYAKYLVVVRTTFSGIGGETGDPAKRISSAHSRVGPTNGAVAENLLTDIMARLDAYLQPVLGPIVKALQEIAGLSLVLLLDTLFIDLPMEGLPCFQDNRFVTVSRDFSLHTLVTRFAATTPDDAEAAGGKGKGKEKDKRKSKGGGGDIEVLEPIAVPQSDVAYIVDPYADCHATGERQLYDGFKESMKLCAASKQWRGVSGADKLAAKVSEDVSDRIPENSEIVGCMQQSAGIIHYGPGGLLSFLLAMDVAGLDLPQCRFAILLDHSITHEIRLREERRAPDRTGAVRALEQKPSTTAALLTLSGVSSVTVNQWETTIADNDKKMKTLLPVLCDSEGGSVGIAVRQIAGIKPAPVEEPAGKSGKGKKGKPKTPAKGKKGSEPEPEVAPEPEPEVLVSPVFRFNTVLYGVPNIVLA